MPAKLPVADPASHRGHLRAAAKRVAENRFVLEAYGNGRVKILNFSLDPGVIRRGQESELCYGVSNAKMVTIEPTVKADLYPAMNRCFKISPSRTTKYTLTAADAQGHSESVSLELQVQRLPAAAGLTGASEYVAFVNGERAASSGGHM